MSPDPPAKRRAEDEAATWFARLNGASVSTAELAEFRHWRQLPLNDEAFEGVERVWRLGGSMKEDTALSAALAGARSRNRPRATSPWRSASGLAIGLGAAALAGIAATVFVGRVGSPGEVYATAGERRTIALSDGSHVNLDAKSRLVVRYTPQRRLVALTQGQALFDVVHRADRPFQVDADGARILDIGTRFDVRREDGHVRVTVVEGSVTVGVKDRRAPLTLVAGQQVLTGSALARPYAVDPAKTTSWTNGRLIFEETPLSTATAEVNRYGSHPIVLRAAEIGDIRVSGAFDSADTAAFLSAVTRLYDLTAETQPDGSVVLAKRPPGQGG